MSRAAVLLLIVLSLTLTTFPASARTEERSLAASELESAGEVSLDVSMSAATVSEESTVDAEAAVIEDILAKTTGFGKTALGRPCCTSWEPGRVDCFVRGEKSNVLHLAIENGSPGEWEDLKGFVLDEIECVSRDTGHELENAAKPCGGGKNDRSLQSLAQTYSFLQSAKDVVFSPIFGDDGFYEARFSTNNVEGSLRFLGGEAESRPCCTSWGPGHVDCFIHGPKATVLHMSIDYGEYSDWENLAPYVMGEIECMSRAVGVIDFFVRNLSGYLYGKTYSEGQWSDWQSRGVTVMEVPSCTVRTPVNIDCLARGTTNGGYHIGYNISKWTSAASLGGTLVYPIGCSSRSSDNIDCFASGSAMHLYAKNWTKSGKWGDWTNLGGEVKGRPSVTTWGANRIDVFSLGTKTDSVMQKTFNGKTWEDWVDLGGVFDSAPECVTTGIDKIHCFAIGANSYLYKNDFYSGKWEGWTSLDIPLIETPSCVDLGRQKVACYARGFNKQVVEIVYKSDCCDIG